MVLRGDGEAYTVARHAFKSYTHQDFLMLLKDNEIKYSIDEVLKHGVQ